MSPGSRVAAIATILVALGYPQVAVGTADRPSIDAPAPLGVTPVVVHDGVLAKKSAARLRASPHWSGGTYQTPAGEPVAFYVASFYTPDPALSQSYVDLLGRLVHGPEISTATFYVVSPGQMEKDCPGAVACYSPGDETVLILGGESDDGVSISEALTHEFGHHIANNRANPPFPGDAIDWGTKRWASYENNCARAVAGEIAPGDEDASYALNPGEAFADSYRILNGGAAVHWQYDDSFFPDAMDLSLIRQDVLTPWTAPTVQRSFSGRLNARSPTKTVGSVPTLDGMASVAIATNGRLGGTAYLIDPADNTYIAKATPGHAGYGLVCGQRQLKVLAQRTNGTGDFSVVVAAP